MDTTKNLNFSANIPQLEWIDNKQTQELFGIIPNKKNKQLAIIEYTSKSKKHCFFRTFFGQIKCYNDKLYSIEEAKKEIQQDYVWYVFSLLNEVSAITNDGTLSYNDNLKY